MRKFIFLFCIIFTSVLTQKIKMKDNIKSFAVSNIKFYKVPAQFLCLFFSVLVIFKFISVMILLSSFCRREKSVSKSEGNFQVEFPFSCSKQMTFEDLLNLSPLDERVINYLRCHHLTPPSAPSTPYNLTGDSAHLPSLFTRDIQNIFKDKERLGFFIECGAADGLLFSGSIALEKDKNWSGVLIEANPKSVEILRTRNRKAWIVNACLSPENKLTQIDFMVPDGQKEEWRNFTGRLFQPNKTYETDEKLKTEFHSIGKIPCFPLETIMAAVGATHIDFMILDVPGVELKILKSFFLNQNTDKNESGRERTPKIDVILSSHFPYNKDGAESLASFMKTQEYTPLNYDFVLDLNLNHALALKDPGEIFFIRKDAPKYLRKKLSRNQ